MSSVNAPFVCGESLSTFLNPLCLIAATLFSMEEAISRSLTIRRNVMRAQSILASGFLLVLVASGAVKAFDNFAYVLASSI